jgi:dolichyl-phosphate-mannose-protein mannosyltransferase
MNKIPYSQPTAAGIECSLLRRLFSAFIQPMASRGKKRPLTSHKRQARDPGLLATIPNTARNSVLDSEAVALGLVIGLILTVQAITLARGFVSVSADEYSRVLLAASWAESPYFIKRYILDVTNVWQPWHFYLLGLALRVHNDLFLTSRIVTRIFSMASLGMLYLLSRKLFNRRAALFSVLIAGLLRAHVDLSLTPMVDVVFVTLLISFLYFFVVWLDGRATGYLLLSALMLGMASSLRYDGWFAVTIFSVYLGSRWLIALWTTRSLHPLWLLAICLACLPIFIWLLGNYIYWGDPIHFLAGHKGSGLAVGDIGPLARLFPILAHIELLLQNGALVGALALVGIALSRQHLGHKRWLYLALSIGPHVILVLRGKSPGVAYRPHYPFPYLVLLTPFCAYTLDRIVAAPKPSGRRRWHVETWGLLALMSLYNLWLVYLQYSQRHSSVQAFSLALMSIALSYLVLTRRQWVSLALSLLPLPILKLASNSGLVSIAEGLYLGPYFVFLVLFYAYKIWRETGMHGSPSRRQWQVAGLGVLATICLLNVWQTLLRIPVGMPAGVIQAGLATRQLFEDGSLSMDDKVLVEVDRKNYKGMQVMSNHPRNFVLDRSAYGETDRESFLIDKTSSPYKVGALFSSYEEQVNPFSLDAPPSLDSYLRDERIRLVVIKDPRLEALLTQQTHFSEIGSVDDYQLYYMAEGE